MTMNKAQRKLQKEKKRAEKKQKNTNAQGIIENNNSDILFVLGNGTSRSGIEPHDLQKIAPVYGCNALYRSFAPDILIAVDTKMIKEIADSGYQNTNPVWTNPNRTFQKIPNLNFFKPSKGWSSGPTALWFASQSQPAAIYILGFDYRGINDGKNFNNIFSDTKNYKKSTDSATYYGNWLRQTRTVIKENPNITYYRVIRKNGFVPKDLVGIKNLHHITLEEFRKQFCV